MGKDAPAPIAFSGLLQVDTGMSISFVKHSVRVHLDSIGWRSVANGFGHDARRSMIWARISVDPETERAVS